MLKTKTNEFWSRHGIATPLAPALAEPAIVGLVDAHHIFSAAFNGAPEPKETSGMILCALENLSNRLYEQAAGMLVCLGSGSAAAAETIARTVIEGAFNLQFIASKDHEVRLFAFFHQFLQEHNQKLSEWEQLETTKPKTPAQEAVLKSISQQVSAHKIMADFVESLGKGFGFEQKTISQYWPRSLYKRCEQIDKTGQYLTAYHRLSASSHINAEETIRWLFGFYYATMGQDIQFLEKLSSETVSFSAMMTRMAVLHYVEANIAVCRALNAKFDQALVIETLIQLSKSIDDIALSAGCPI